MTSRDTEPRDRIEIEMNVGEPEQLDCYPALLNQVLLNLVANAIDAIEGRGKITIVAGQQADSYVIAISDTGPGIPRELRERILEPFFTTKPVGQGTGLGLSIAYSIVQKHRGSLVLGDAPGGGALATIRLPLEAGEPMRG